MTQPEQAPVSRLPLVGPRASDIDGLVAVIRRLTIARTLAEVMDITTHAARTLLQADGITFVLREVDLCYYAEEDAISPLWKGYRFPMSACISGWCMLEGKPAIIPDIYQDARIPQEAYRPTFVRSLAMVPVRQEAPIAAMGAYWATRKEASDTEVQLLQTIANAAALAIAFVQLRGERERAAGRQTPTAPPNQSQPQPTAALTSNRRATPERAGGWVSKPWIAGRLRPNSPAAYGFAGLCVAVAILVRAALGFLLPGHVTPFATFYPAILFAALVGGATSGALAVILGALCAWWAFIPPYYSFHIGAPSDAMSLGLYISSSALMVWAADGYRRMFGAVLRQEETRRLLIQELQHRMRNTLAVVQAIVSQSLRHQPEAVNRIGARIAALGAANDLDGSASDIADLKSILLAALGPYRSDRIAVDGKTVDLPNESARILALTFHELATNAAKYGSLSVPNGRLSVSWQDTEGRLIIRWVERDGPPVKAPTTRGFGTSFIGRLLDAIGGRMDSDFHPNGLQITIELPH